MEIQVLIENKTYKGDLLAEHGLSLFIEANGKSILYDFGWSDILIKNAEKMNIDLKKVEFAVVSHGHMDHTGGMYSFSKINNHAPVYIHKNAFKQSYTLKNGKLSEEHVGIKLSISQYEELQDRLIFTDGVTWLGDDIVVSGTIPPIKGFEPISKYYVKDEKMGLVLDQMEHEQFLAIRDKAKGGVYVFSGCSHTGVTSCVKYAQELFRGESIKALIAGMHLYGSETAVIKKTIDEILSFDIQIFLPVHCTGIEATCELKTRMKDKCIILNTGNSYKFE